MWKEAKRAMVRLTVSSDLETTILFLQKRLIQCLCLPLLRSVDTHGREPVALNFSASR